MVAIPSNPRFKNITGQVFGRWTVAGYAGDRYWECVCACGYTAAVFGGTLKNGASKSCGCLSAERSRVHGDGGLGSKRAPEYTAYYGARDRCTNPTNRKYADYGARGIEFNFDSYQEFLAVIGRRPSSKHSLDRVNVNGNYELGNVRWATIKEQNRNTRTNILLTVDGATKTLPEWAEIQDISPQTLKGRYDSGWCHKCAVTIPVLPKSKCMGGNCPHVISQRNHQ